MAARLTSTGVLFADGSALNSKYGIVPINSSSVFYQAITPIGWVKNTSYNGHTLRAITSGGGGSGGSSSFTTVFAAYSQSGLIASLPASVQNYSLSNSDIPSHTHGLGQNTRVSGGGTVGTGPGYVATSPNTTNAGSGSGHSHPFSSSFPYGYSFNIQIRYIDVILCSFA
jgi:hypothetical protein